MVVKTFYLRERVKATVMFTISKCIYLVNIPLGCFVGSQWEYTTKEKQQTRNFHDVGGDGQWMLGLCVQHPGYVLCAVWGVTVYVTHSVYLLPTDERLGCISLLSVVNGAGVNIHVQVSVGVPPGNSSGLDLGVLLPAQRSIFTFWGCVNCFTQWPHHVPFSPARCRVPASPRPPTTS